jgi:hypothetical protein
MKKYWTTAKYKLHNKRRADYSLQTRLRGNRIRSHLNYSKNLKPKKFVTVEAPENFTLIGNPDEVIKFVRILRWYFQRKQRVWVVLKYVKAIDYDAIVVLLSIMVRFKAEGILFNGDFPTDGACRKILDQSGFISNLNRRFDDVENYTITAKDNFLTHGAKLVRSELGADLITEVSSRVWGKQQRCPLVQTTLVELMQNTFGHAVPEQEGGRHWWLSINHSAVERKLRFSFVDYGVGIFKSLSGKSKGSRWFGVLDRLFERFHYGDNAELLKLILNGELHRTVTNEYFRGQGLPGILDAVNENALTNLHILTNNVHAKVSEGVYVLLKDDFPGTFIYWEVIPANQHFDLEV